MKRIFVPMIVGLFLCLLASASSVQAGGFALYEWSARGLAMGTTGYAQGVDASVVATNPSLMTKLPGNRALAGVTFISPQASVLIDGQKNKTKANIYAVPHAYYVQQMESNENVWFGIGMFTRYGLGTEYDKDWAGKSSLQYVDLESTSVTPTMAFKFSDDFSLSLGVEVLRGTIKLQKEIGPTYVSVNTEGYAVGGNVGMHYDFNDQWSAGLIWRAPMKMYTTGSGQYRTLAASKKGQSVETTLPGSYTLGVAYQPNKDWTFEFDVMHTRWESVDSMKFSGPIEISEELHYKNTWRFQLGAEYHITDWMALRGGYVYDQTPTRAGYASFMLPANDRRLFSGGLGFNWDNWTVDLSAMYVTNKERKGLTIGKPGGGSWRVEFMDGVTWATGMSIGYTF